MRKGGVAEWVLKRAAGAERGTAMYGDLVELRPARGGAWFWMAYLRTLVALTWRTWVGLAVAWAVAVMLGRLWLHAMLHFPRAWRRHWTYSVSYLWLNGWSKQLVLLASYAAVRYGPRDRMARAGLVLWLPLTGVVLLFPAQQVAIPLAALALAVLGAFLLLPKWRGAAASLAAAAAASTVLFYGLEPLDRQLWWYRVHAYYRPLPTVLLYILDVLYVAVPLVVCTWLHRRFVPENSGVSGSAYA